MSSFQIPDDFSDYANTLMEKADPPPHTFEFGLVLAGTVAAGAYTAGFVDFLTLALDEYYRVSTEKLDGPPHKVMLSVISGTSGGGIVAAQAGRALKFKFPHARPNLAVDRLEDNLFFKSWVTDINMHQLLDKSDLVDGTRPGEINGLLNTRRIEDLAEEACQYGWSQGRVPLETTTREWIADPLELYLTCFNMRGIPHIVPFGREDDANRLAQEFFEHDDFFRIQLYHDDIPDDYPPDVFAWRMGPNPMNKKYGTIALATSAFPVALKAREINRPIKHYLYRPTVVTEEGPPDGDGKPTYRPMPRPPFLSEEILARGGIQGPEDDFDFVAVDGGTAHNEPVELARTHLAGLAGRNPREGDKANRAVVLVAPLFSSAVTREDVPFDEEDDAALWPLIKGFIPRIRAELKLTNAQLSLATDQSVFSRFIVIPSRPNPLAFDGSVWTGDRALCSSGMGAFLGFMHKEFRKHDYWLGRYNAYLFLKSAFVLNEGNRRVFGKWTEAKFRKMPEAKSVDGYQPLVPLVGAAAREPSPPRWPAGLLTEPRVDKITGKLENRIKRLLDVLPLEGTNPFITPFTSGFVEGLEHLTKTAVGSLFKKRMLTELEQKHLLHPLPPAPAPTDGNRSTAPKPEGRARKPKAPSA